MPFPPPINPAPSLSLSPSSPITTLSLCHKSGAVRPRHAIEPPPNSSSFLPQPTATAPATSVHELLECAVCTNSMYPPIHQVGRAFENLDL